MAELIRINNTRPAILHLPDEIVLNTDKDGPRIAGLGTGKSLIPGGNNVDKDYWGRVKVKVKPWLELGWITEGGDVAKPEGPEAPKTLSEFNQPKAISLIEIENDRDVLKRWRNSEHRAEVKAVLDAKLDSTKKKKT